MYCQIEDLYKSCRVDVVRKWCVDNAQTDTDEVIAERMLFGIQKATDTMNLYLTKVTSFPLKPMPTILVNICVTISLYYLLSRKGFVDNTANEVIYQNYKDSLRQLEMIASGKLEIIFGDSTGDGGNSQGSSSSSGVASFFPPSKMDSFRRFGYCGKRDRKW
ncbi:MAG: phage protein Gp36 family protein [Brevinema sp.]